MGFKITKEEPAILNTNKTLFCILNYTFFYLFPMVAKLKKRDIDSKKMYKSKDDLVATEDNPQFEFKLQVTKVRI